MTIDNLSDLKKIIALCRKSGVTAITIDGITMTIAMAVQTNSRKLAKSKEYDLELPPEASLGIPQFIPAAVEDKIETQELSEEQLLFYSARPEDPNFKEQ